MPAFASKIEMQHRLFAELSRMFGNEVPLYDKSLLVNLVCNRAVCDLLAKLHPGFEITNEQISRTSGERHGAIRIGTRTEYRRVAQFFAAFAMEPHNFYDMTNVGSKSQPIIATAFRSTLNPEHRVFCSLLQTNYFDPGTQSRIEALLATREVFSTQAIKLIEKNQREGGLSAADADSLVREGVERIFKWTGKARDHKLYKDLADSGFKIAADIACFESHHLNHLTPNTFCMDLYTAAMKHVLGEMDQATLTSRATTTLSRLTTQADRHHLRLHFRHLSGEQIEGFGQGSADGAYITGLVSRLLARLHEPDLNLAALKHAGFKEFTEGPAQDTPVLLRQDAYKALTEPVEFHNPDGTVVNAPHTARFGEIEERFYATTPAGRELYDTCLALADAARDQDPGLPKRDFPAYEAAYAAPFAPFPKTLDGLVTKGLVYAKYEATPKGIASSGTLTTTDIGELVQAGYARREGVRYEDFLPVSAAGIFASNLNQYGTKSTAAVKPKYTQAMLEEVMGRPIVVADQIYQATEAASLHATYEKLGLLGRLASDHRAALEIGAALLRKLSTH